MRKARIVLAAVVATSALASAPARAEIGRVSGRVVDGAGAPIEDACVWLYDPDGARRQPVFATDANGRYEATGLSFGSYRVLFQDCRLISGVKRFVSVWWSQRATFEDATVLDLTVDRPTATGIDAVVGTGGAIAGAVADGAGVPLAGVCVEVDRADRGPVFGRPEFPVRVRTGGDGRYRVGMLAPDPYVALYSDCTNDPRYVTEWFENAPRREFARPIPVAGDGTTPVDVRLALGSSIVGSVRSVAGDPVLGICVDAYGTDGLVAASFTTGLDGAYRLRPLGTGTYRIGFRDCGGSGYDPEFHQDRSSLSDATQVPLSEGETVTIGAVLTRCRTSPDTDEDGLTDCEERDAGTRPDIGDTDADRLSDGEEVKAYRTDPMLPDSDGDLFSDGAEVKGGSCLGAYRFDGGSDPNDGTSTPLGERPGPALPRTIALCR